jgi:hypothetical protein
LKDSLKKDQAEIGIRKYRDQGVLSETQSCRIAFKKVEKRRYWARLTAHI